MSNLIIIDTTCVRYHWEIINYLTPDTEYVLINYIDTTLDELKSKITKNYSNVVIAKHNNQSPSFGLVFEMHHGRVYEVLEKDPELLSWNEHIQFFRWLKEERGVNTIDWLACNIWAEDHWVYIINKLKSVLNIDMRASTNITGPAGDYILESDNIDLIGLYFTENIRKCPENFAGSAQIFNNDQNALIMLDGSGGVLYRTKFQNILHGPYMAQNIQAQPHQGYVGLTSDVSNIIYIAQTMRSWIGTYADGYMVGADDSFLAVRSDRTGFVWGSRSAGAFGLSSTFDASLVNIKRVFSGVGTFAVLRNDNTVYSRGLSTYYVSGNYDTNLQYVSPYVETRNTKAIPNPLTNVKNIYVTEAGFAALKFDGTVVTWGSRAQAGDSRICQSYLTNITKIVVIRGWGGAFVALRSDGNFVAWKGDTGQGWNADASMNSYFATSIGSSITGRVRDIMIGSSNPSTILFLRNDNWICYAFVNYTQNITTAANITTIQQYYQLPAGVSITSSSCFNTGFKLSLSNGNTIFMRGGTNTLVTDSDNVVCPDQNADGASNFLVFKLLFNGSVSPILSGNYNINQRNGGFLNDPTYGLPTGTDVSSNVVQLVTTECGVGALKADGIFLAWGCGGANWAVRYDSSANNVRNVVAANDIQEGYRLFCADGSLRHAYSKDRIDWLNANNYSGFFFKSYTPDTGKSLWPFFSCYGTQMSYLPIELDAFERASPSSVVRYSPTTITYVSNLYHRRAIQGFNYGLYCGGKLISSFRPLDDTSTFTFNNCKVPDLGNGIVLTVSRLSVNFPNTMFSFTVNTTENPSISVPDPPIINSITVGVERITVSLSAPSWDGGTGIDKYSYSMNGGSTWTLMDVSSSLVVTGLTSVLYSFAIRSLGGLGYSSANTASVVMCSVPNAPVVNSATAGNRTLTVAFTSPSGDTLTSSTFGNYSSLTSGSLTVSGNANNLLNGVYTFSASSNNGTNLPYHAFDNSTTTFWSTASASYGGTNGAYSGAISTVVQNVGTVSGEWIQIQSPSYIRVQSYSLINNVANSVAFPSDFILVGSNDGTSWFPIDSRSGQLDINANANNTISFTVAIPTTNEFYRYYRLIVTRLNGGSQLALKDFRIIGNTVLLSNVKGYNYSLNGGAVTGFVGATQSPLVITGLNNGTSYTISLRAVNIAGQGAASNTLAAVSLQTTVPEVPVINTLTYGNESFAVAFTAPYNGGSAITKYQYSLNGGTTYVDVAASSNPFTVSGLTNGSSYNIIMRAVNAVGNSAASASAGPVVPKRVPDAPVISSAQYGNQSGTVSFSANGSNGGSAITGYSYSLNGGADVAVASSPLVLTGLTNGTTYTITIKSINVVGSSAASASASFVPKTVPSAPVISSATVNDKQVSLSITPSSNGGSAITDYKYALDGSDVFVSVGTTTPIVITELNNGQSYSVVVKAVNEVGESAASSSVSFVPKTVPNAPIINTVSYGNQKVSVSFSAPENNGGSSITGYKLSVNGGAYNSIGLVSSPFDVSGLTNGTTYTFAMKATNVMGDSSASSISASVVPKTVPTAPVITLGTFSDTGMVRVYFSQGTNNGGSSILSYSYLFAGSVEGVTYNTTPIPLLVSSYQQNETVNTYVNADGPGEEFTLTAFATNEVGDSSSSTVSFYGKSLPTTPNLIDVIPLNRGARIRYVPRYDLSLALRGGGTITGFKYYFAEDDSVKYNVSSYDLSYVYINNLTENNTYYIGVVAVNEVGESYTGDSVEVTPYTNPQSPTITSITVGNKTATINYTAGASNSSDITSHKYSLNNGSYVTLPNLSGSFVLNDLSNGVLYSIKMRSTNEAGDSADSSSNTFTTYSNPFPPTISSVTIGNESADIFFRAGFANGSPITGYKYCITGGEFDGTTYTFTSRVDSPINISGLSNGVGYTVKLKAVNAAGDSVDSNSSIEFMTYVTQSSPNPPILISATTGNGSATINFVDDVNPGSEIVGYKYSLNGGAYVWANQPEPPIIVDNLTNGTTYTLRLKAVNGSGPSAQSATALTFTPSDVPSTPVILQAIPSNQSITLQIIESELYGSALVNYHYQLNNTGDYYSTDISNGTIVIGGLTNGTSYTVKIKAENTRGMSAASISSLAVVPFGLPTPPTITNVVAGDKQLSVYFTAGEGNGAAITKYSFATVSGGQTSSYLLTEDTSSPIVISGLINGTAYAVRLKSVSIHGSSEPTDESEEMTPFGVPEPPVITYVSITDGSANIHFETGNTNGSEITDYMYSLDGGEYEYSAQTTNPILLNNLNLGDTYTIRLKAVTSGGTSLASNVSQPFTVYSNPLPPTITSIVPADQKLIVHFSDATLNGCTLLGYKYDLDNSGDLKWGKVSTSPLEISGLENGTPYLVGLKTICAQGESSLVNHTQTATPSNIQLPPNIIGAVAGNQSIVLTFANPERNGAIISGYSYSLNSGSYVSVPSANLDISASTITINGLTNGENYVVRIKSVSNVGTSAASNATESIMPFTNPSPPTITRVVTGSQIAYVHFTDGSLNGSSAILGYRFSLDGTNYIWSKETSSPLTLSGLINNVAYNVRVVAVSSSGSSAPSAPSSSFVPFTFPEPPTVSSVLTGNGTALINLVNGATNGRPITGYQYSLNGGAFVSVDTTNPISISGLTNGTTYIASVRSVTAAGASLTAGSSIPFVPYTAPGAPVISSVTPADQSLIVSVSNPTLNGIIENGINIIGYQYSLNGGAFTFVETNSSTFTLSGLTNGTTYTVTVRSVCAIGISASSATSSAVAPRNVPAAPTITGVVAGNKSVVVSFTAGATNGAPLISYKYSVDGVNYLTATGTTSPISIFNLSNGVNYVLYLRASNVVGDSPASAASASFTPFTTISAPVIKSISVQNAGAVINVENSYIGTADGSGIVITGYRYSFNNTTFIDVSGNNTSLTITGLVNGTSYQVYVRTVTNIGVSPSSNISAAFVPKMVPSAPTITGVVSSNKSVVVSFTDGSNNGAPITGYKYSFDNVNFTVASQTSSPLSIFGLTNGVSYNVYVVSTNVAGDSPASAPSTTFIPYASLTAPLIRSITSQYKGATFNVNNTYIGTVDGSGINIIGYQYSFNGTTFFDVSGTSTSFSITGLENGSSYRIYVRANTNIGLSPVSALSASFVAKSIPDAPTILSVVPGEERATMYFTDGSNNGSAITGYKYSYDGVKYFTALQMTSPIILYSLSNATTYNITLKATNDMGDSPDSNSSGGIVPFGVPFAPVLTSIVSGNASAIVYMNPVNNNGSPVIKYRYTIGSAPIDISGTTLPLTITGLTNKVLYNIKIIATNAAGDSYASNALPVLVGTPTPPVITEVVAIPRGLRVFFEPANDNGNPITQYSFLFEGSETKITRAAGMTSPITIASLTNGLPYNVMLQAVNKNGSSVNSNKLGNRVPFDIPSKITITNVVPQYSSALVSFTAPPNNGSPITKYGYSLNGGTTYTDLSGLTLPIRIPDLPNNINYTIQMVAYNAAGMSPVSSASKSVRYVYTAPAQVKITSITAGNGTLTVVFTPPAANGAPITTYKYAINTDTTFTDAQTTTLPLVITGLANNTNYNVRIIATNEAGDSVPSTPAAKPVMFVYLPPNAPVLVSAIGGNQNAQLVFNAPAIRGAPITGYKYSLNGGTTKLDITGTTSPLTITGLTNDVSYNVLLYADSEAGLSLPSIVRSFIPVYKAPERPTLGTIIALNQGASVGFTAGAENGAPITNYLYSFDGGATTTSVGSTVSPFNITGLTNDLSYNISLIAVNEVGNSLPSLPKLFVPIYRVPSPPTIGTITTTTTGANVAFVAGAFNGSPITTYLYSLNGDSFVNAAVSSGPIVLTGLTSATTYSIVLKAVNQVGESLPSVSKSFTTKT